MKCIYILLIILIIAISAKSQNTISCIEKYKQAEKLYYNGDYNSCISNLEKALYICEFSKIEKQDILILLIKAYIEIDNIEQAEATIKKLFQNNPNYELINDDNEDFINLVRKFNNHPLFSIGIRYAIGQYNLKITKVYSVLNDVDYSVPYTTAKNLQKLYGFIEFEFKKNISLNAEISFYDISYNRILYKEFVNKSVYSLSYSENLSLSEIPLYLKKQLSINNKISLNAILGIGWIRIIQANANPSITINEPTSDPYINSTNNINVKDMRNINTFEWIAGMGIGYRLENFKLNIDFRYSGGLNSLTNTNKRYDNTLLYSKYYYIDNSIHFNMLDFSLSIAYILKYSNSSKK